MKLKIKKFIEFNLVFVVLYVSNVWQIYFSCSYFMAACHNPCLNNAKRKGWLDQAIENMTFSRQMIDERWFFHRIQKLNSWVYYKNNALALVYFKNAYN